MLNLIMLKRKKIALIISFFMLLLVSGTYLWYFMTKKTYKAEVTKVAEIPSSTLPKRSLYLHNYLNWYPPKKTDSDYQEKVQMLAKRDNVFMTESYAKLSELDPQILKSLNPNIKVYILYDLNAKNSWDSDVQSLDWSGCKNDYSALQTPISCQDIVNNDWWLRDGNGNIVIDPFQNGNTRFLDVGKPGYKEAFLQGVLDRLNGKDYDGIIFDYWWPYLSWILQLEGTPPPPMPEEYPTDDDWFNNAWKPFIDYVMDGLHNAGYKIIGNCAGEYVESSGSQTWQQRKAFQRSKVDGIIYEQGVIDWWESGDNPSGWLQGSTIEDRINSLLADPKEVWQAENGLSVDDSDPLRAQKQKLSLAMYYIGLPQSEELRQKRSYGTVFAGKIYWDPTWDFYIGTPAESPIKMTGKYFWSKKFTLGLVLMNYESEESIPYVLDRTYIDEEGEEHSGTITLPPHTGMILRKVLVKPTVDTSTLSNIKSSYTSISFAGTAEPNATVKVYIESEPIISTTSADAEGKWNLTVNHPLSVGEHSLYVTSSLDTINSPVSDIYRFIVSNDSETEAGTNNQVSPAQNNLPSVQSVNKQEQAENSSNILKQKNIRQIPKMGINHFLYPILALISVVIIAFL